MSVFQRRLGPTTLFVVCCILATVTFAELPGRATLASDTDDDETGNDGGRRTFQQLLRSAAARRSQTVSRSAPLVKWRDVVERLLEVRCFAKRMNLMLHYDPGYSRLPPRYAEMLKQARLFTEAAGKNLPSCMSTQSHNEQALMLSLDYDDCGVEMSGLKDTVTYSVTAVIQFSNNATEAVVRRNQLPVPREFSETYRISCLHPVQSQADNKPTFSLVVTSEKFTKVGWSYPKTVEVGSLIFLSGETHLSWYNGGNLHSLPVECWTSPEAYSGKRGGNVRRKLFVKDGCPVNDDRGRGLSHIHHMTDGPTKVSINLGRHLLFVDAVEQFESLASSEVNNVTVGCDFLPCVQNYTFGILGIPKCPVSYFCAGIPQISHILPEDLRSVQRTKLVSGLIIVKEPSSLENVVMTEACQKLCAQSLVASVDVEEEEESSTIYIQGISTKVVVAVAFISFVLGMVVTAGLWFIHSRTVEPRKGEHVTATDVTRGGISTKPSNGVRFPDQSEQSRRNRSIRKPPITSSLAVTSLPINSPKASLLQTMHVTDEVASGETSGQCQTSDRSASQPVKPESEDIASKARRLLNTLR